MHKTMYFSCFYEAFMKNVSSPDGKPTDLNQNKLWMQSVTALICVNHQVNLSLLSKESLAIS